MITEVVSGGTQNFNRDRKKYKKDQSELNTVIEIKKHQRESTVDLRMQNMSAIWKTGQWKPSKLNSKKKKKFFKNEA